MENISIIITPALTMLLVGLIVPWAISMRQRAEQKAIADKCLCYPRSGVTVLWITSGVAVLLTAVALICTILSIVDPEMMDTTAEDIPYIILTWGLCIALDVFTITLSVVFMRKITYNSDSFTDIKFYKKHKYLYKDITKIESTVKARFVDTAYGVDKAMKGKLKIYFGENCVKISAKILGITEFMAVLQKQCPTLYTDLTSI